MPDNLYSRLVGWLKVLLPVGALILLSTLFLLGRRPTGPDGIPFAEIEEIANEARIAAPRLAGVTDGGIVVEIAADRITPEAGLPDAFRIHGLSASLTEPGGASLSLSAADGLFDGRARQITLAGLARIETSTGYRMETRGLAADLATGRLQTDGALEVQAPYGSLTAGRLAVESGETGQRLVFSGGVRLLYQP